MAKAKKPRKTKTTHDDVRGEVVEAMKAVEPTEREQRIVALWTTWENAKAYLAKARSETRIALESARASLKDVMTRGLAIGDDAAVKKKLFDIEVAWQDFEEAKGRQSEETGSAKSGVKAAFERLNEAVSATNQMGLNFQAAQDAEDDEADESDDGEDPDAADFEYEGDDEPRPIVDL
jgi:hypothetical protein